MSSPSRSRWWLILLAGIAVVAAVVGGIYFLWFASRLPEPGSPLYQKYVAAFQVGTAVMDVGGPEPHEASQEVDPNEPDLALQKLNEAIEAVPEEPAGLANRGLWYLRRHFNDKATRDLKRAEELAADDPGIQNLLGLLAQAQGKFTEAVGHFRKALEKNPKNLITLYYLSDALEQEAQAKRQRATKTIGRGAEGSPYNLRLLRDKGILAAQLGDTDALAEAVNAYVRLAPGWSGGRADEARDQLKELVAQASGPLPGDVPMTAQVLDYLLQPEHNYTQDALMVDRKELRLGEPLEQFVRLKPMRATASPPDAGLTFDPASPVGKATEAVAARRGIRRCRFG